MNPINDNERGPVMKVVAMGIEKEVLDALKQPNFSAESLARKLSSQGKKISAQSIRKYVKKVKKAQQAIIQHDAETVKAVRQLTMDYTRTIKNILKEVEEVKNEAKTEKDMVTYNQMIDKLYKGIELMAKLAGDLKPNKTTDITIIYKEIADNIENEMRMINKSLHQAEKYIDIDYEVEQESGSYSS